MSMIRLLHTSDWHLGATFHGHPRDDEEDLALDGVVAIAREQSVDVVIVAGDVYDTSNPPATASQRFFHTLHRLVTEAGVGTVVVIGGNHDQGLRLEAPAPFLASHRVLVRGHLPRSVDPADTVVPLHDRQGTLVAWAALVPYLRESDLIGAVDGPTVDGPTAEGESTVGTPIAHEDALLTATASRLGAIGQALARQAGTLPRIVVHHAFAAGGTVGTSERPVLGEVIVGRLSRCDLTPLADGCAYVALGHLHRPQRVGGRDHWRYCGSLLPMAMDEVSATRSLLRVDLDRAGQAPAQVTPVNLPGIRAYRRFAGSVAAVRAALTTVPRPGPGELEPWCDLQVEVPVVDPGLSRELEDAAAAVGWRALAVRCTTPGTSSEVWIGADAALTVAQVTPDQVFAQAVQARGLAMTDELAEDFAALLAHVQAEA